MSFASETNSGESNGGEINGCDDDSAHSLLRWRYRDGAAPEGPWNEVIARDPLGGDRCGDLLKNRTQGSV